MAKPTLPRRFEDRGTTVPFEGRSLRLTRLRVISGATTVEWEATVAGFWGGSSRQILVVPWRHLASIGQMSPRDETLFKAVDSLEDAEDINPFVIRDVVLKVDDRLGHGKGALGLRRYDRAKAKASLLAILVHDYGRQQRDRVLASLPPAKLVENGSKQATDTLTIEQLTGQTLDFHGKRLGLPAAELGRRLDSLAELLTPLGEVGVSQAAKEDGFLIRCRNRLRAFDHEMIEYEKNARHEMSDPTAMIRFAVKQYLGYVDTKLASLEEKFVHLPSLLREADRTAGFLNGVRRDVAYALDGWDVLMDIWDEAKETGDDMKIEDAVMFAFTNAPLMPLQEIDTSTESGKVWRGYETVRGGLVKMMHSWNDGEPDDELMKRTEEGKQREKVRKRKRADPE
ncbi:MAG: hypothetical protein CMM50_13920 [Rhodospirillaceae bacterium]|nr:hypothetical protein [Rhodospirillaceae bacterium]